MNEAFVGTCKTSGCIALPFLKCTFTNQKLSRIDELAKSLPGRDCGACGCPSCAALAEDIVLGRAAREACVFGRELEGK